jgi:predicted phage tail component-like protein
MYTLEAENTYGQRIELTHNDAYVIESIIGLDPPESTINTTRNASADGSIFNSAFVNNRTITITLAINAPAEENRIELYTYFKSKMPVRLYYKNAQRNVYIDGYVRNIDIGFFEKKQVAQITILCPKPFFNAVDDTLIDFTLIEGLFEFPFDIIADGMEFSRLDAGGERLVYNEGDVETGFLITLAATAAVVNPQIYNVVTNEYFALTMTMAAGDEIVINTKKKEKSVTLTSGGIATNIVGNIKEGSTWLQLAPGTNYMIVTAETYPENLLAYCIVTSQFEGV